MGSVELESNHWHTLQLQVAGAQRLLDAQRQLEDLQGAQGEAAARLVLERKRSSELRLKVEELKQRLHAALREQRRLVQQVPASETPGLCKIHFRAMGHLPRCMWFQGEGSFLDLVSSRQSG